MNESDTRLKKIDPLLTLAGWGTVAESHMFTEQNITTIAPGRITSDGRHRKPRRMDYLLVYRGQKIGIVEAKADTLPVEAGIEQAKEYADTMKIRFTYACNGDAIYQIDMATGKEGLVDGFPSPDRLWQMTFPKSNTWRDRFNLCPLYTDDRHGARYYQEIAIRKVTDAIADGRRRVLLTMATGTGKTYTAFQICWKLMETRWNTSGEPTRLPRILFLSDRNILSDQAEGDFCGFKKEAIARISPDNIRLWNGFLPKGKSLYFTIFQTFMTTDSEGKPYYTHYQPDFFDLVIIDECHRGGANDESQWRGIMEYFADACQLGLTATPRRDVNADTYEYFGEPVYTYSLKQGIADGYLTPFRVMRITGDLDDYRFDAERDKVVSGEVDEGRTYTEADFYHGNIEMRQRDELRVEQLMRLINPKEKTIVFCATQNHALQVCAMINQRKPADVTSPFYCCRVTADDGDDGERQLKAFQDNEMSIPTILTTSRKLSTGVDARNVRNIVLMRPVNNMVEFKQILGRGTRLFDDKHYFTLYDFVRASDKFNDADWDGLPEPSDVPSDGDNGTGDGTGNGGGPHVCPVCGMSPCVCEKPEKERLRIRLSDSHVVEVRASMAHDELFMFGDELIDLAEYIKRLFGCIPKFFHSADDLRRQWSDPDTRAGLISQLEAENFSMDRLSVVREMLEMEKCDMMDVLEFLAYHTTPLERERRVALAQEAIMRDLTAQQQDYAAFVLNLYKREGFRMFSQDNVGQVITMKYGTIRDAKNHLGSIDAIQKLNHSIQQHIYSATA